MQKYLDMWVLWMLMIARPVMAQTWFPDKEGDKVRYNAVIEMKKGYMSGVCILVNDGGLVKGSLFNEFGISAMDFTYRPDRRKVKLLSVVKMLDKWYVKRVLRKDLAQLMELLRKGAGEYKDERFKINYKFTLLEDKQEENDTIKNDDATEE